METLYDKLGEGQLPDEESLEKNPEDYLDDIAIDRHPGIEKYLAKILYDVLDILKKGGEQQSRDNYPKLAHLWSLQSVVIWNICVDSHGEKHPLLLTSLSEGFPDPYSVTSITITSPEDRALSVILPVDIRLQTEIWNLIRQTLPTTMTVRKYFFTVNVTEFRN